MGRKKKRGFAKEKGAEAWEGPREKKKIWDVNAKGL